MSHLVTRRLRVVPAIRGVDSTEGWLDQIHRNGAAEQAVE